jgi:hypothetical protein
MRRELHDYALAVGIGDPLAAWRAVGHWWKCSVRAGPTPPRYDRATVSASGADDV